VKKIIALIIVCVLAVSFTGCLSKDLIGENAAKQKALSHAGASEENVKFSRVELDGDMGRTVYEVEFYSGNMEYDYKIDAKTGDVIEYEADSEFGFND